MDTAENQIVVYGYSIFDYVKKYDPQWKLFVEHLERLYIKYTLKKNKHIFSYPKRNLNAFPPENVYEVMKYLDDYSLLQVTKVCKQCKELASREELWEHLLFDKFGIHSNYVHSNSPEVYKRKKGNSMNHQLSAREVYKTLYQSYHGLVNHKETLPLSRIFVPASLLHESIIVR